MKWCDLILAKHVGKQDRFPHQVNLWVTHNKHLIKQLKWFVRHGYCNYVCCQALWWRSRHVSALKTKQPPTIQSVIELRKGTTGRHNFQSLDFFFSRAEACSSLLMPALCREPNSPLPQPCNDIVSWKKWPFCHFRFAADFIFYLRACFILCSEAWIQDLAKFLLRSHRQFWGSDSTSLDVAVVFCAVCLWHIHLSNGVTHMVHPIFARRHTLIDAVQALSLLKAGDLVLGGEPTDSWKTQIKGSGSSRNSAVPECS